MTAHYDNGVGSSDAASAGHINAQLIDGRLLLRPGEVMEYIPGMIITQHSGGGKANQYCLRGFNLDHGTDFETTLDGMPVNMPSHAHGQGYTDLNFMIPEVVSGIDYYKGPYYAAQSDFATAGSASIRYIDDERWSVTAMGYDGKWNANMTTQPNIPAASIYLPDPALSVKHAAVLVDRCRLLRALMCLSRKPSRALCFVALRICLLRHRALPASEQ